MDIQNCLNHSILISNLAPMATFLISSKGIALQTKHVFQVILKHVGRHGANMGIDFLNAVNSGIDHRNIQYSALTLTSKRALAKI